MHAFFSAQAYQHRVGQIVEIMHCEALALANDHLELPGGAPPPPSAPPAAAAAAAARQQHHLGTGGRPGVRISDSIYDMAAYRLVTDGVFHMIRASTDPALLPAQEVLERCVSCGLTK
jgi:hypothetical protein